MDTSVEIGGDSKKRLSITLLLAALISFVLYWLTCFRTFTWWDSSEYSLAALTLGVPHPPGSLLTVILGWMASKLPLGIDKFFELNLLASVIAAVTVYLVGYIGLRLYRQPVEEAENPKPTTGLKLGAFFGALTFGVSITTWFYAIRFTPYITTSVLTAFIIIAMLAWQRRSADSDSHLWLGLATLLFGLDFSVHRTNLLMLPALLIWILIFKPKAFISIKHWVAGIVGLAVGLSVQLLTIPIAAAQPVINMNNPNSPSRFWDYITLKQYGGGWLINIFPRKAPFLSVQIADYFKVFGANFANSNWAYLGFLPLIIGLTGLALLFKRNWKLALGLTVLFIFSSFGAIIYFNLPENFFRSIDRHYMPSFVIFAIFIAYGAATIFKATFELTSKYRNLFIALVIAAMLIMPLQSLLNNYQNVDGSNSYFAYDTAKNFLSTLPRNAIFFSQADVDTYTLWCIQQSEKFRSDLTVCNLSLMNTPWFIEQVQNADSIFPLKLSNIEIDSLNVIPWHDSTIAVPINANIGKYDLPAGTAFPELISLNVTPTVAGKYILVQDQMILKIIQANNWNRPICFSSMISESNLQFLKPYLRLEGLHWRLVPVRSDSLEREILKNNLINNYVYRGYLDKSVVKENPTNWVCWNYCSSFVTLASMESNSGDTTACRHTMTQLDKLIAPDMQSMPPPLRDALAGACR
jgi:hypothetical protein